MRSFLTMQSGWRLVLALSGGVAGVAAPTVSVNAPPAGATNVGSAVTLDVGVSGATGTTTVTFYGRKTAPSTPGPDFVLGTLPDTQYYSQNTGGTRAAIFHAQTQWYLDNRVALNLAFISHMGDLVQTGDNSGNPVEWQVADGAMARIEHRVNTLSAYGIPWGGAPGNHDTSPNGNPTGTSTFFNQYFGETRFAGRDFYRGHYGTTNNNNYEFFSASGLDFIVIHLTYRTASITAGEQDVLDWADALLKAYPNRRAIVTSHWILGTGNPAPFQGPGQRIYDNLKDNPNLFMLLCGHVHGSGRRTDVFNGNTVHSMLQDFQDDANGGDGWLRYFIFSPTNNTISARTFSPTRNNGAGDSRTDSLNQFTLTCNLQGATTDWIPLGTATVPTGAGSATLPWTGLETNSNYEWYVAATDSSGTATTTARRFATVTAQPPVVTLTAPSGGATFTAPATVNLSAAATDSDGTIARVEFYQGATKLGEDTTGPSYDLTWSNPPVGSHVLSAVAVDNTGRGTLSNVVGITVSPGAGGGSFSLAENFTAMGTSGATPPAGWSIKNGPSGTSTSTWTSSIPGTGTNSVASMINAAGALTASNAPTTTNNNGFNAGAPGNTANRMLATSPTTNAGSAIQLQLTNSGSGSISQLLVGYDMQRFTAASSANELPGFRLFYSLDNGTNWTNVVALNPAISGSTGVVVPNTTGVTTVAPTLVTLSSPWAVGATLLFRWVDDNAGQSSPDQILGLDNVTIATPAGATQPPTIGDIANQTINEDGAASGLAFTVNDPDTPAASLTVSGSSSNAALVPNANIAFGGSGSSRTVTVTPLANQSGTSTITVTVSDGTATASDTFVLTVNAVNDSPTISDIGNQSVSEDAITAALAFTVSDVETAASSLSISGSSSNAALVPNANIAFGGSGSSRTVTVTPLANQSGTSTITVTVSDGTATASDTFVLTVNAVNDSPAISDIGNQSINEDTATAAVPFTVGDAETAAGSLSVSGSSSNAALVPNANIVLGGSDGSRTVTVTPLANQSGSATITVTVSDGTTAASDTFVLTVNAVNDSPTVSDIGSQSINEDSATGAVPFTVGDVETAVGSLTVSGSSSNAALVPNANIVFGGSGGSRTVTVTPLANQSGSTTITVTVSDGVATATDTFLLVVAPINDAPTISVIGGQTVVVNEAVGAIGFTIGDLETPVDNLTVNGSSSNQALLSDARISFGGTSGSRTVLIDPIPDQTGSATITVTVNDGEATASTSFQLTVNSQPDSPPTVSDIEDRAIDEDTTTGAIEFTVGDTQTAAGSLIVTASSSNATLVPAGGLVLGGSGADRTLIVTPAANQNGTTTITVTVDDGNATTTDTFLLTVNAVNDSPTVSDVLDLTLDEDTATSALLFTVGDVETLAGNLIVSGSSSNPALVSESGIVFGGNGSNRTVTITPLANQNGAATITLTVTDGVATSTDTFVLTVGAINDVPTTSDIGDQAINEDTATAALGFVVGDIETAAGSLSVSGSSSNQALVPNANLAFGGSGANRTLVVTPVADQSGTATITVTVSDGTAMATDTFVVTVNAVNDPPVISNLADLAINEDTSSAAVPFTVGDVETAAGSLSVSGSSSNPTLVPNANLTFGGSGASRTVTVTPLANQNGQTTITVTVSDGLVTTSDTFVLTVNAVNDSPTISDIVDQTTSENTSTAALPFTVGDIETAVGSLVVTGSSSNAALVPNSGIVFGGSGASRTVTITPAAGQSGAATVTVSVSDGVATALDTFLVTVNAAPPPSGTFSYSENFDSLGASGVTPPSGWSIKAGNSGSTASSWTSTIPGTGSNSVAAMVNAAGALTASDTPTANNNNGYNAGTPGNSANRLLATAPTTVSGSAIQLLLTNTSSGPITQLRVSYNIRRFTAATTANELPGYRLFYSLSNGTTWTNVTALNPAISGGTGVVVPNTAGLTTVPLTPVALDAAWAPGASLLFRWVDDNAAQTATDQILGLDDVTITTPLPPTIVLTAPEGQSVYVAPAGLSLAASVSDTEGVVTKVEFYAGTTKLGEDVTAPYGFNWNGVSAGAYVLTAVANTTTGPVLTSGPVTVTVLADTDADGLPDEYESASGLNPNSPVDGDLDLDGDALSNRLEYALGMPANLPNRIGLPTLGVGNGADSGKLTFSFKRQRYELTYTVLASNDLKNWTNLSVNPGTVGSVVTVTDNNTSSPNRYLRLAVTDGISTALTIPVGRITYTFGQGQTIFIGFPLHRVVGSIAGQPAGFITGVTASALDNANGGWTPGQLSQASTPYFVRITRGTAAGRVFPIATDAGSTNTATRLTLATGGVNLTTLGIQPGVDTFELFPADTLNSMFPAGTLLPGNLTTGDVLWRWNGVAVVPYYFDGANWRDQGGAPAGNFVLPAFEGWQLDRRGPATTFTLLGQAPSMDAKAVVTRGMMSVISLLPVDRTFAEFPLQNLVPGWASNPADPQGGDHVLILEGSVGDLFYFDGTKWVAGGGSDASNTLLIKAGRSFLLVRPTGTGSSILTQPRPY